MSTTQSALRLLGGRKIIAIENRLGGGGEGEVYSVHGDPSLVAKILHENRRQTAESKLREMLRRRPTRTGHQGHVVLAWPDDLLVNESGRVIGYVMAAIPDSEKVYKLKHPASRKSDDRTKRFMYDRLVSVARNLASAVELAHAESLVVGDLNAQNILVSSNTNVSLIDVDSFQFVDSSGRWHLCSVGTPEYLAPELIGKDLSTERRSAASDLFSLSVLLYELLMEGQHPYAGVDRVRSYPPDVAGRIALGLFPGAQTRRVDADIPRASPPREMLGGGLLDLFNRCFDEGHSEPTARPSAREWRLAIGRWAGVLRACVNDQTHIFDPRLTSCPWCVREGSYPATPAPPKVVIVGSAPSPGGSRVGASPAPNVGPPSANLSAPPGSLAGHISASPTARVTPAKSNAGTLRYVGLAAALIVLGGGYGLYMKSQPQRVGETCKSSVECQSDLCILGQCAAERHKRGEACLLDQDCVETRCLRGTCRQCEGQSDCSSTQVCKGSICVSPSLGEACQVDNECGRQLRCAAGVCAPKLRVTGETCTIDSECAGVCVMSHCRPTQLPDGSKCLASSDCANLCLNGTCGSAPPPVPTTSSSQMDPRCRAPDSWDDAVRGWAKLGKDECNRAGTQKGVFLRAAWNQDKETSKQSIQDAWKKYVDVYLGEADCPRAKEMVFFNKSGTSGAGILFPRKPPHWDEVVEKEPQWLVEDGQKKPVVDAICFFPAEEERRPTGW